MITELKEQFFEWLPENNRLERIWKLAQVEFKKRYYNDRLGLVWALLNPLFQMGIYYLVFKYIYKTPCLLYTSPSPRDKRQSRMPSSA